MFSYILLVSYNGVVIVITPNSPRSKKASGFKANRIFSLQFEKKIFCLIATKRKLGLLMGFSCFFSNSKNLNCIGKLSFFKLSFHTLS